MIIIYSPSGCCGASPFVLEESDDHCQPVQLLSEMIQEIATMCGLGISTSRLTRIYYFLRTTIIQDPLLSALQGPLRSLDGALTSGGG